MTGRRRAGAPRGNGRWWALAGFGVLAVAVATATTLAGADFADPPSQTPGPDATDPGSPEELPSMAFGVLGSECDWARSAALYDAGVRYAEIGVDWSSFEPDADSFDARYQEEIERKVDTCRDAGLGVVLTLGVNSAPGWVSELDAGAYVNQDGDRGPDDVPNLVFSAAVREEVTEYLTELDAILDLDSMAAIRVGTGINGELGYPTPDTEASNPYWAFDAAAQDGQGLADGMSASPMPGWTPGAATWRDERVSTRDVEAWFHWYSRSLADAVVWVVQELRAIGYTRDIHLPLAGRGALPAHLEEALDALLDDVDAPDRSLQAGLYYPEQLRRIARALARTEEPGWGTVSADSSSVDDSTAVSARRLDPPQDRCRPDDASGDLVSDPGVEDWSSFRWTTANARAAGLGVVGENPGPPSAPGTGADDQTHSAEEQLDYAPQYAKECGMTLFQWAFEDTLFRGDDELLRAYAQRMRELEE